MCVCVCVCVPINLFEVSLNTSCCGDPPITLATSFAAHTRAFTCAIRDERGRVGGEEEEERGRVEEEGDGGREVLVGKDGGSLLNVDCHY